MENYKNLMSATDIIEKKMNDTKVNNFFQSKYEKQITIKKIFIDEIHTTDRNIGLMC